MVKTLNNKVSLSLSCRQPRLPDKQFFWKHIQLSFKHKNDNKLLGTKAIKTNRAYYLFFHI